ncbi:MAG: hypothetical protein K6U74_16175, partial [Firmicutes bacterium]|nr:hypothetical protein [Bacillota bacterium]
MPLALLGQSPHRTELWIIEAEQTSPLAGTFTPPIPAASFVFVKRKIDHVAKRKVDHPWGSMAGT